MKQMLDLPAVGIWTLRLPFSALVFSAVSLELQASHLHSTLRRFSLSHSLLELHWPCWVVSMTAALSQTHELAHVVCLEHVQWEVSAEVSVGKILERLFDHVDLMAAVSTAASSVVALVYLMKN